MDEGLLCLRRLILFGKEGEKFIPKNISENKRFFQFIFCKRLKVAEKMIQLVKCLLCKHEDPSSIPHTHVQ